MTALSRPLSLVLAVTIALTPAIGEAKRHGHGYGHHGWMHARFAALRGWFRHADDQDRGSHRRASHRSRATKPETRVEQAELAARRRSEVDDYLRTHPAFASAE